QIVVMTLPGHTDSHLPQGSYAIGIPAIVGRTDLTAANPIVNYFLLVLQISEVSANHWSEFVIRALSGCFALNTRERAKSCQQKSEKSSADSCHGLAPGER